MELKEQRLEQAVKDKKKELLIPEYMRQVERSVPLLFSRSTSASFHRVPKNLIHPFIYSQQIPLLHQYGTIGVNTLSKFMKVMTDSGGISGGKTNHSARNKISTE